MATSKPSRKRRVKKGVKRVSPNQHNRHYKGKRVKKNNYERVQNIVFSISLVISMFLTCGFMSLVAAPTEGQENEATVSESENQTIVENTLNTTKEFKMIMITNDPAPYMVTLENDNVPESTEPTTNSDDAETSTDANVTIEETTETVEESNETTDADVEEASIGIVENAETEAEAESESYFDYTDDDVKLLGNLMYAEEGVLFWRLEHDEAMYAHELCGSVLLHRVELGIGGDNMYDIIFTGSGYAKSTRSRIESGELDVPDEVYELAERLLKDGPTGPKNLIFQAQFIQGEIYEHINNQYFCLSAKYPAE